jgi:hypothetical protein
MTKVPAYVRRAAPTAAPEPAPDRSELSDLTEVVAGLPHRPGVYRMINETGDVLYVG